MKDAEIFRRLAQILLAGARSVLVRKRADVEILVSPAVFAASGNWKIVSAPAKAMPGEPVQIVVSQY